MAVDIREKIFEIAKLEREVYEAVKAHSDFGESCDCNPKEYFGFDTIFYQGRLCINCGGRVENEEGD